MHTPCFYYHWKIYHVFKQYLDPGRRTYLFYKILFVFLYFKSMFLHALIQYCITPTPSQTGAEGRVVPLALLSFWSTIWTSNRIRWTLTRRCSIFFPLFTPIDCVRKIRTKKFRLLLISFDPTHNSQPFNHAVFAFYLKVSREPEQPAS